MKQYGVFNPSRFRDGYHARMTLTGLASLYSVNDHEKFAEFDRNGNLLRSNYLLHNNNPVFDIRTFTYNGRLMGIGTDNIQSVLVDFDAQPISTKRLTNVDRFDCIERKNKNWTPLQIEERMYLYTDTTLKGEIVFREINMKSNELSPPIYVSGLTPPPTGYSRWRGSTNWEPLGNNLYLGMIHTMRQPFMSGRDYVHVFVLLNWEYLTAEVSQSVCLGRAFHARIQFATSLHLVSQDTIEIGWGENDSRAYIQEFSKTDILNLFHSYKTKLVL